MLFNQLFDWSVSRRRRKSIRSANSRPVEIGQVLEPRLLLTVIWTNEGNAGNNSDGFNTAFGANAATARQIVNHAIDDWNATIASTVTLNINISAGNGGSGFIGGTAITGINSSGIPTSALVGLDDNADGNGWFFDTSIYSDAEFDTLSTPFYGEGAVTGVDLYTVTAHEIGHALGYANTSGLAINNFLTSQGGGNFQFYNTAGTFRITESMVTVGGLHSASGMDLMSVGSTDPVRRLISDDVTKVLVDAYGYGFTLPSTRDTLHVNVNPAGTEISVTPRAGAYNDSIWVEFTASGVLEIRVNGTREGVYSSGDLTVNGGAGDDFITISEEQQAISNNVTVIGGPGTDSGHYRIGSDVIGTHVSTDRVVVSIPTPPGLYGPYIRSFDIQTDTLTIAGTSEDDDVTLANSTYDWVSVYGFGGNDFIDGWNNGNTTTGVLYAFGGEGNDTLWGTPNADILMGGNGDDSLWGGNGRDFIGGGDGGDSIGAVTANQSTDEDIVIGGFTQYDDPYYVGAFTALTSIRAEWISSRSRADRIANILGVGSGPRENGNWFLSVGNDGDTDSLSYYTNSDWVLFG